MPDYPVFRGRRGSTRVDLGTLFWTKVDKSGECWLWLAGRVGSKKEYGFFSSGNIVAHKWAWEAINGPVPEGLVLDHICRNTLCVRPNHLEAVTQKVNLARSNNHVAKYINQQTPQGESCPQI